MFICYTQIHFYLIALLKIFIVSSGGKERKKIFCFENFEVRLTFLFKEMTRKVYTYFMIMTEIYLNLCYCEIILSLFNNTILLFTLLIYSKLCCILFLNYHIFFRFNLLGKKYIKNKQ